MKDILVRLIAAAFLLSTLLPALAGCAARSEKSMETPNGLSARQVRERQQGLTKGQ